VEGPFVAIELRQSWLLAGPPSSASNAPDNPIGIIFEPLHCVPVEDVGEGRPTTSGCPSRQTFHRRINDHTTASFGTRVIHPYNPVGR
jgi:hypothetical protein